MTLSTDDHPATINWTGAAGNNRWDDPNNWDLGRIPNASDDVSIDVTANVVHNTGNDSVRSLYSTQPLTLSGGTLSIAEASKIFGTFTVSTGTFTGAGDLTVLGALNWTGGSLTGTGGTILAGGTLNISGATTHTLGARPIDNSVGTINFNAGTITGSFTNVGAFNINLTGLPVMDNLALTNAAGGTITTSATGTNTNALHLRGGTVLTNQAGGTLDLQGRGFNNNIVDDGPSGAVNKIVNAGTLYGGTYMSVDVPLDNGGTVEATGTPFFLTGGGNHTGGFVADSSKTLWMYGTNHFGAGTTFSGAGTIQLSGGTSSVDADLTIDKLTLAGATLTGDGTMTVTGTLGWTSGTLTGSGGTVIASGGQLAISGGAHTIGGRPIDNTAGPINFNGGTLTGSFTNRGAFNISLSGVPRMDALALTNAAGGTILTYLGSNGTLDLRNGTVLTNQAGGTLDLQGSGFPRILDNGPAGTGTRIVNAGTLLGNSFMTVGVPLDNSGTVQSIRSTLALDGGGNHTGAFIADATRTISFGGDNHFGAGTSFSGPGTIAIVGGTASVDADLPIANLTLAGGTLTGAGTMTITGTLGWTGGTLTGTGGTILTSTGRLNISGSSSKVIGGRPIDNTAGPINLTGSLSGSFTNPGTFNVTSQNGSLSTLDNLALTNAAGGQLNLTVISNTTIDLRNGTVVTNAAGGTINLLAQAGLGGSLADNGPAGTGTRIINAGSITSTLGGRTMTIAVPLDNGGTVRSASGTVALSGGGDHSGAFIADSGATLQFGGGTHHLSAGTSLSGPGSVQITGGTTSIDTDLTVTDLTLAGGTLTGDAKLTVNGTLSWTGGTLAGAGDTVIASTGQLAIGGAGTHTFGGRPINNTAGPINWTGGTITGSFTNSGAFNAVFANAVDTTLTMDGMALTNASGGTFAVIVAGGTGTHTGTLDLRNGTVLTNQAGGTIDLRSPYTINIVDNGTPDTGTALNNAGTLRKAAGSGNATLGVDLSNSGTIAVDAGLLSLTGKFSNFDSATGTLTAGTYNIAGTLKFNGASIQTNAATIIMDGASSQIVDPSNSDALAVLSTNAAGGNLTLRNGRNLTTAGGAFQNRGIIAIRDGGTLAVPLDYTQASGTTTLAGATLTAPGGVMINGGSLAGDGTVNADLTNAGTVIPGTSPGLLSIAGNYTQSAAGTLQVELGGTSPGTGYDQLDISGLATLDGTLDVSLSGGFTPVTGQAFQILTYGSRSGSFAHENFPTLNQNTVLQSNYNLNDLTLVVNQANTPPTLDPISDQSVLEDSGETTINLTGITAGAGDTGQVLTVSASSSDPSIVPNPTISYTSPDATGTLIFTTLPDVSGMVTITVTVTDDGDTSGGINVVSQTFTVTVNPVNDAPTLDTITNQSIPENSGSQAITLTGITAGASDESGQILMVSAVSSNTSLIPDPTVFYGSPDATATLTFTPATNQSGTVTITVTVHDDGGTDNGGIDTFTRTFVVTVTSGNHPPTASDVSVTTDEDTAVSVMLDAADVDGDTLSYLVLTQPTHGTLSGTVPNLIYSPDPNYNGTDSFTYQVNDGLLDSNTATVSLTITAINDAPTASDVSVTTDEDTAVSVMLDAADVDGDTLIVRDPQRTVARHALGHGGEPDLLARPQLPRHRQLHLHRQRRPARQQRRHG